MPQYQDAYGQHDHRDWQVLCAALSVAFDITKRLSRNQLTSDEAFYHMGWLRGWVANQIGVQLLVLEHWLEKLDEDYKAAGVGPRPTVTLKESIDSI